LEFRRVLFRSEERGAIGGDDVVADLLGEFRMFAGADHPAGIAQGDIPALVVPVYLRLDFGSAEVRSRVHVGTETDDWNILVSVGGHRGVDIAVFVEVSVGQPDVLQLIHEEAAEVLLLLRGRLGRGVGVGLGVDHHVAEKAVKSALGHLESPGGRYGSLTAPSPAWEPFDSPHNGACHEPYRTVRHRTKSAETVRLHTRIMLEWRCPSRSPRRRSRRANRRC